MVHSLLQLDDLEKEIQEGVVTRSDHFAVVSDCDKLVALS